MNRVRIAGVGSYLPERVVENAEIAPRLESTDEWIVSHTGIERRHVAAADESASVMGASAAWQAMGAAKVTPDEIGLVIVATTTPDYGNYPSTACMLAREINLENVVAFDIAAACTGFMYGLEVAKSYLLCHPSRKALVVGTEVLSRQQDWSDRTCAMLFGDGAGAAVLEVVPDDGIWRLSGSILGSDGEGAEHIMREGGARQALCEDPVHDTVTTMAVPYLKMDGHAVFTFAVRKLEEVLNALCSDANVKLGDLDLIVAHQANLRILDAVIRRVRVAPEKFYLNLKDVGNTSSASIPICLDQAIREGKLKDGMRIAMAGFGSGLTWAGMLSEWPYI